MTLTRRFNHVEAVVGKTIEYLSVPAVVGHEGAFLDFLEHDYRLNGRSVFRHDGLLEIRGKHPESAIVCVHIDRHGLISLGNGEFVYAAQYMKEIKYGENNPNSQKELENITQRFANERVFAYDDQSGLTAGEGAIRLLDHCLISGYAIFHVDGIGQIDINVPVAYARTASATQDYLKGQIDNAISLGVLFTLFRDGFEGTALLTTEEEIGKSWVHITNYLRAHEIETNNLLVLDTSPYADSEPIKDGLVILRHRDMSEHFNKELTDAIHQRCVGLRLPHHFKDRYLLDLGRTEKQLGSTELGRVIQKSEGRWSGATIQIPTLMYHTSYETTSFEAIRNYHALLYSVLIADPLDLSYGARETPER